MAEVDDSDLLLLFERAGYTGLQPPTTADAAERMAAASEGRAHGPGEASSLLPAIFSAAASAGWGGGEMVAHFLEPRSTPGNVMEGREHALRGATAEVGIVFPGANAEAMAPSMPPCATAVGKDGGALVIFKYLSSGSGTAGAPELHHVLAGLGVRVAE